MIQPRTSAQQVLISVPNRIDLDGVSQGDNDEVTKNMFLECLVKS